jgi:hypothetical protein
MNWMAQISRLISTTIVRLCKNAMDAVGSRLFLGVSLYQRWNANLRSKQQRPSDPGYLTARICNSSYEKEKLK